MARAKHGQALTEMALVLPVMLSVIIAALTVGQLLLSSMTVQHALRAAVQQAALSGGDRFSTEQAARAVLAGGIGMQQGSATLNISCAVTPCRRYDEVTVGLRYTDRYWLPIGIFALNEEYVLEGQATRLVERDQP